MNKTNKIINITLSAVTVLLFFLSCFFTYDFYKCLSGFIANGFREPLVMLPLILTYLAPVLAFLFFFYDFFIKSITKPLKVVYVSLILVLSVFCLVGIITNFSVYVSNNALGVYESLPSIIIGFPYDGIVINAVLILAQVYNIFGLIKPKCAIIKIKEYAKRNGAVSVSGVEYVLISLIAIFSFVFIGSGLSGFIAIENALFDGKYLFLMAWLFFVSLANLLLLIFKIEKRDLKKQTKIITLSSVIALNLIFAILVLIFEIVHPDFMIYIAKPLFMIAFSVSLPIEQVVMFAITIICVVVFIIRLIKLIRKKSMQN